MVRYFYPAERVHHAACMAIDFGMKFKGWKWSPGAFQFVPKYRAAPPTANVLEIHPDSLHLLEPQDGDVIDCRQGANNTGCGFQDYLSGINEPRGKIIQRNGKPFHWPEKEDA